MPFLQGTIQTLQDMIRDTRQQRFMKESPQYKLAVEKLFQAKQTYARQQAIQRALMDAPNPKAVLGILKSLDPEGYLKTAGEFGLTPRGKADIGATEALTEQRVQVGKTSEERGKYYKARTETPEKFFNPSTGRIPTVREKEIGRIITKRDKGETLTKTEQKYLDDYFLKKENETDELLRQILLGDGNQNSLGLEFED